MKGKYFKSFDGTKIYFDKTTKDKNKWLIFLHGFGGDFSAWDKERVAFSKSGISTIAMDLRGHGFSDRSEDKDFYKMENFSKDILSLIEEEKIKNPVIVGHCLGGMVAMNFMAKNPKSSKGLVLIDTSFKPPFFSYNPVEKTFFKLLFGLLSKVTPNIEVKKRRDPYEYANTKDIDIRRIISDATHTSLKSYLTICESLVDLNAKGILDKIKVPTLVVEGSNDSIFPPDIAIYLASRIKNSELDFIPGGNHILVLNRPEDLEKSIEGFLKKIHFI